MRLRWSPSTRAGLLGTGGNATFLPCAPHVPPPSPMTQNTEGGGVWAEHLRWAAPRERRPLFGGVYVLVPIWLGARRVRPGGLFRPSVGMSQNFWGGT